MLKKAWLTLLFFQFDATIWRADGKYGEFAVKIVMLEAHTSGTVKLMNKRGKR